MKCHLNSKIVKNKSEKITNIELKIDHEREFRTFVKYLSNPWSMLWRNFLMGTIQGIGFVLGTAIFLTIVGYITSKILGEIPFFSDLSEGLTIWLQSLNK